MRQLILPDTYQGSSAFTLTGDEFHYLTRVLRLKPGDTVPALDHQGRNVTLNIESVVSTSCSVRISRKARLEPNDTADATHISLVQCMPKGQKMDLIVRQATETGVREIIPLLSAHTVPVYKGETAKKKHDRWLRIAKQAMQQSGNIHPPAISPPQPFKQIDSYWHEYRMRYPGSVGLFFHQNDSTGLGLHSHLQNHDPGDGVVVCIGPEGGFSSAEVKNLLNIGFHPVYIKTNVFRTETAALYAVAAIQTVLLEKNLWSVPE